MSYHFFPNIIQAWKSKLATKSVASVANSKFETNKWPDAMSKPQCKSYPRSFSNAMCTTSLCKSNGVVQNQKRKTGLKARILSVFGDLSKQGDALQSLMSTKSHHWPSVSGLQNNSKRKAMDERDANVIVEITLLSF